MYAYNHIFLKRGDNMKLTKDIMLMTLGAGMVIAYQKYKEPLKEMVKCKKDKMISMIDKTGNALEDMM